MFIKFTLISILVSLQLAFVGCNQPDNAEVEKPKAGEAALCACKAIIQPPPPHYGEVLSTDTMILTDEKSTEKFTIKLIADKQVDLEGNYVQIYKVKANNSICKNDFDFALPVRFNLHWQDVTLKKDSIQNRFAIGFKDSACFQVLYSVSLGAPELNKGYVHFIPDRKRLPL